MENQTHISVQDLNVHYRSEHVLKNITVNIPDRKITAIIGPSGCGKTTLLKSFNRLIDSVEGVSISGGCWSTTRTSSTRKIEVTHIRKKMGLLLQKPYPLPMSIYDNVAYGPRIHGIKNRKRLDEIVEHYPEKSQPLGRGQGPAPPAGLHAFRRPAAAPLPGPRPGGRAGDHPRRRADVGPRSAVQPADRADIQRVEKAITPSSSSPISCARPGAWPIT